MCEADHGERFALEIHWQHGEYWGKLLPHCIQTTAACALTYEQSSNQQPTYQLHIHMMLLLLGQATPEACKNTSSSNLSTVILSLLQKYCTSWPCLYKRLCAVWGLWRKPGTHKRAKPKSAILILLPLIRMLSAFKSQWTMSWACKWAKALSTRYNENFTWTYTKKHSKNT